MVRGKEAFTWGVGGGGKGDADGRKNEARNLFQSVDIVNSIALSPHIARGSSSRALCVYYTAIEYKQTDGDMQ